MPNTLQPAKPLRHCEAFSRSNLTIYSNPNSYLQYMTLFCFLLTAFYCGAAFAQDEKYFKLHKDKIKIENSISLASNGVYIRKEGNPYGYSHAIFLYNNGIIRLGNALYNPDFGPDLNDSSRFIQRIAYETPNLNQYDNGVWGFYIIRHDTLIVERPYLRRFGGLPPYISQQEKWKITSSKIYPISREQYKRNGKGDIEVVKDSIGYTFYPYHYKPDSTYAWFFYKDWYMNTKNGRK